MNREKKERTDARDERWRQAQRAREYIDQFTTEPEQPVVVPSFKGALNQKRANRGQKPI